MSSFIPIKRKAKKQIRTFKMITVVFSADSRMPTIRGKWERLKSGNIRARYTLDEYAECLELFELIGAAKESS